MMLVKTMGKEGKFGHSKIADLAIGQMVHMGIEGD